MFQINSKRCDDRIVSISQPPDWPDFRYDKSAFEDRELEFRLDSGRAGGQLRCATDDVPGGCRDELIQPLCAR